MEGTSSFILQLIVMCAFVCLAWGHSCPSHQTSANFTVNSRRNQTGHWISQVRIEQGTENNIGKTNPWRVEVEHNTSSCNGVESIQLIVTFTEYRTKTAQSNQSLNSLPGYEHHPGVGYYKIHSERKTWNETRQICAQEGGHLVIINSEDESKVLQTIFANARLNIGCVFIGFHDMYTEGQYLTIFDEPLSSTGFYRWSAAGQPNNRGGNPGQDCGCMNPNGGLNDVFCHKLYPFICEQELRRDPFVDVTATSKCHENSDFSEISPEVTPE